MADRAASNYTDVDADDEIKKHLSAVGRRKYFNAYRMLPDGPGDVPDDDMSTPVILLTESAHSQK